MSVDALRLENYRGFEKAELELRPLTVLLGPNSAGKSTFGRALAGLQQAHAIGGNPDLLRPARTAEVWRIDFGSFRELARDGAAEFKISLKIPAGWVEFGFGAPHPEVAEGIPLKSLRLPRRGMVQHTGTAQAPENPADLPVVSTGTGVASPLGTEELYAEELVRDPGNPNLWRLGEASGAARVQVGFRGLQILTVLRDGRSFVQYAEESVLDVISYLNKLCYLGPDRAPTERDYTANSSDWIGVLGDRAPAWLHAHSADEASVFEVPPIPHSRADAKEALARAASGWSTTPSNVLSAVVHWLRHLDLAYDLGTELTPSIRVKLEATLGLTQPRRRLADLGHGVEHVLPVIVGSMATPPDGTFVVEQPEGQLHPRAQASLADLFCAHVYSGRKAIVETHSETLFRRLRVRAALDPQLEAKIAVYFIDRWRDGCAEPVRVSLHEAASLRWPEGFLTDALDEDQALLAVTSALRTS